MIKLIESLPANRLTLIDLAMSQLDREDLSELFVGKSFVAGGNGTLVLRVDEIAPAYIYNNKEGNIRQLLFWMEIMSSTHPHISGELDERLNYFTEVRLAQDQKLVWELIPTISKIGGVDVPTVPLNCVDGNYHPHLEEIGKNIRRSPYYLDKLTIPKGFEDIPEKNPTSSLLRTRKLSIDLS